MRRTLHILPVLAAILLCVFSFQRLEEGLSARRISGTAQNGPVFVSPPGLYEKPLLLKILPRHPTSAIFYQINSPKTSVRWGRYSAPFLITSNSTVKAMEVDQEGKSSAGTIGYYQIGRPREVAAAGVTLWYNQPSGVRFRGRHDRTYFAWLAGTAVTIRYLDHDTEEWSAPSVIAYVPSVNDHAAPALQIVRRGKNTGKILVFYGLPNEALMVQRSERSEDIRAWTSPHSPIAGRLFYPNPIITDEGKVLLFFSKNAGPEKGLPLTHRTFGYALSKDDGDSWSGEQTLVDFGEGTWIYAAPVRYEGGRLLLAWSGYSYARNRFFGAFVAESRDEGSTWSTVRGTALGLPVDPQAVDDLLTAQRAQDHARVWDIRAAGEGIALTFVTFNSRSATSYFGTVSRLDGRMSPTRIAPTPTGYYPGGVVLDPANAYSVVVAVERNGKGEIEAWCSSDEGTTWQPSFRLTQDSVMDQVRPQITVGPHGADVTWLNTARYASYSDYAAGLRMTSLPAGLSHSVCPSEP